MLAKRLGVELPACQATGRHGLVSVDDVLARANLSKSPQRAPAVPGLTDADKLRGPRKAMAQSMSLSRDEIAMCTIFDDADIDGWKRSRRHYRSGLVRAIVAGVKAEPALNALFDPAGPSRKLMEQVHLAIAVDTNDGLIVPVLRDVASQSAAQLRVLNWTISSSGRAPYHHAGRNARLHVHTFQLWDGRRTVCNAVSSAANRLQFWLRASCKETWSPAPKPRKYMFVCCCH